MPGRIFVDTNVLLRLLLQDHDQHHAAADRLFESAGFDEFELVVTPPTLSEVVFVLGGSIHKRSRTEIVEALRAVLDLPLDVFDRSVVATAIELFESRHPDWDDCLLAAYALEHAGGSIASFDKGLDGIDGVARFDPLQLLPGTSAG